MLEGIKKRLKVEQAKAPVWRLRLKGSGPKLRLTLDERNYRMSWQRPYYEKLSRNFFRLKTKLPNYRKKTKNRAYMHQALRTNYRGFIRGEK